MNKSVWIQEGISAQLFCQPSEGDEVPLRAWAAEHGLPVEDPPMRVFE